MQALSSPLSSNQDLASVMRPPSGEATTKNNTNNNKSSPNNTRNSHHQQQYVTKLDRPVDGGLLHQRYRSSRRSKHTRNSNNSSQGSEELQFGSQPFHYEDDATATTNIIHNSTQTNSNRFQTSPDVSETVMQSRNITTIMYDAGNSPGRARNLGGVSPRTPRKVRSRNRQQQRSPHSSPVIPETNAQQSMRRNDTSKYDPGNLPARNLLGTRRQNRSSFYEDENDSSSSGDDDEQSDEESVRYPGAVRVYPNGRSFDDEESISNSFQGRPESLLPSSYEQGQASSSNRKDGMIPSLSPTFSENNGSPKMAEKLAAAEKNHSTGNRLYKRIMIVVVVLIILGAIFGGMAAGLLKGEDSNGKPPISSRIGESNSMMSPSSSQTLPPESERFALLKEFIIKEGISSEVVFSNALTPQFQALSWVANEDSRVSLEDTEWIKTRYSLAVFYYSLNGPFWLVDESDKWLEPSLSECDWASCIFCNTNGSIVAIEERVYINMEGILPSELNHLSGLETLILNDNRISGLEAPLINLKTMDFDKNTMFIEIPSAIFKMTNLETLILSENVLEQTISREIGNLSNLVNLELDNNLLTGNLTSEFRPLAKLKVLSVKDNMLGGKLMDVIGGLSNLEYLDLSANSLSGSIEPDLLNSKNLSHLDFHANFLEGEFPNFVFNLADLEYLDLSSNRLNGTISSIIGAATNLQELYASKNRIGGTIPSKIGQLDKLVRLVLEGNDLNGTIASDLGLLDNLKLLGISTNSLSGPIPNEIGLLTKLEYLYLNSNILTGTVPSEIQQLSALTELRLGANDLNGTIASEICNLPLLGSIDLDGASNVQCDCPQC